MALYDTKFGLPQSMVDYLNQGLPSIQQPYRPGYDKNYGPREGMAYTTVMPQPGYDPNENADIGDPAINPIEKLSVPGGNEEGFSVYNPDPNMTKTFKNYVNPFPYDPMDDFGTSNYGYVEQPKKGIQGLFDQYIKGSIPAQLIGKTVKGLANMLPVSKAGILQNELLGAGFMLDNTGKIVANDYNTPQGIMAGYNPVSGGLLNMLTGGEKGEPATYGLDKAYDKRRETVAKALEKMGMSKEDIEAAIDGEYEGDAPINPITGKPTTLVDKLSLFNQSQNLLNKKLSAADIIYNRKLEERREENKNKTPDYSNVTTAKGPPSQIGGDGGGKDYSNVTTAKGPPSKIGGGGGPSYSGMGSIGSGGSKSSKSSSKNSSQAGGSFNSLGFSDIRLKENIELIGKSPSNINIYKFNYKDNPITYQGAMAHEVPWASVKHSNGYMMVDYNLIDIEFKKYNA
jgi:hypothetical protein